MKKDILFDLDGTLTDSGEGIIRSTMYALEEFGLPVPNREALRFVVGPPLEDSFRKLGVPEERIMEAITTYRKRYNTLGKFENFPYPGIRELLEKLAAKGHRLYVATSKPEAVSIEILEHFDLSRYFTRICGASGDLSRSSKASVIAYLLEQCGDVENTVMVGDTAFDILGAKAHNIPAIGVAWGYGLVEDMENAGAAAIAHTVEELYEILMA